MWDFIFQSENFIRLALILQASGFLVRDELKLRSFVMLGSLSTVAYYFTITDVPLWDAIVQSSILAAINIGMICVLIYERTTLAMTEDQSLAFGNFKTLSPGQFRKLFRQGNLVETPENMELAEIGRRHEKLYLVLEGEIEMRKGAKTNRLNAPAFIGEVGFILDGPATADVRLLEGGKYVEWDYADIRGLMARKPSFHNAMIALFSSDLATKLGHSTPIE